jgi:GNAT superfamily N-acetyltransferase
MSTGAVIRPFGDDEYADVPQWFLLLEPHQDPSAIADRCRDMRAAGWFCIGAYAGEQRIAMAGVSLRTHLFSGRVAYVENLVVEAAHRGSGIGQQLMAWIEDYARDRGCSLVTLDAYQSNKPAHAFYERLGYEARGVHFVREM